MTETKSLLPPAKKILAVEKHKGRSIYVHFDPKIITSEGSLISFLREYGDGWSYGVEPFIIMTVGKLYDFNEVVKFINGQTYASLQEAGVIAPVKKQARKRG